MSVKHLFLFFFSQAKEQFHAEAAGASNMCSIYTRPKTKIRAHIRYRGHKQKIVAGVKSVNRFNKVSLGQKGLLLTTNRVLV